MTWEELEKEHEEVNSLSFYVLFCFDDPMLSYCYFIVVDPLFDEDGCEFS